MPLISLHLEWLYINVQLQLQSAFCSCSLHIHFYILDSLGQMHRFAFRPPTTAQYEATSATSTATPSAAQADNTTLTTATHAPVSSTQPADDFGKFCSDQTHVRIVCSIVCVEHEFPSNFEFRRKQLLSHISFTIIYFVHHLKEL